MSLSYTLDDLNVLGKALSLLPTDKTTRISAGPNSNIADTIFGINHTQIPIALPKNRDRYGLTFFTRPQLNMSKQNLRNVRLFSPLLTNEPFSYPRAIRSLLDPRMQIGSPGVTGPNGVVGNIDAEFCPTVDNQQAFFSVLTNNIKSISGWKDIEVPHFAAKAGAYREEYAMVDGISVDYTSYQLTATFRNMRGNLITQLFFYWAHYMTHVFEGMLMPYADYIVENMRDYDTRIYRLVLDVTRQKVQGIAATGVGFPTAVPKGQQYDFAIDQPYNDANADIAIPFLNMGAQYDDDILIYEFNETVCIFNPSMRDGARTQLMVQIPESLKFVFSHRGYARINPNTYSLEWWIFNDDYAAKMNSLEELNKSLGGILPTN